MQSILNLKIKFRESFRPFAPSVLEEHAAEYFDLPSKSPYMLLVAPVKEDKVELSARGATQDGFDKLKIKRSVIPAVTHVDYSARIQTVSKETHPIYYETMKAFYELTGCPVIINTSFNIRGEPIVCTPEDAYRCFMCTDMDYLIMGNYLFDKTQQLALFGGIYLKQKQALFLPLLLLAVTDLILGFHQTILYRPSSWDKTWMDVYRIFSYCRRWDFCIHNKISFRFIKAYL